ncbi:hypothetical protein ACQR1I_36200 [Bradyrhizobium sp. HKCCYLS2038]|uniref:hypothetical protein n=1 Tax=Bradyrhizobium sp. HKCCYLS2038 TaxID=3420764 RepID=UPI003EBFA836
MSETKKRLLLAKWRAQVETLHEIEDRLQNSIADRDATIERAKEELAEANEKIESLEADQDWRLIELETVLTDVKYWLHDGLVHHKLVSDPRALLRKIENVIG